MNIGMVCYASVGGSGVVATELALAAAGLAGAAWRPSWRTHLPDAAIRCT